MNIQGAAAIVSGGGTGLGEAAARLLVARGARVAILGRRADVIAATAGELGCLGLQCDVADAAEIDRAVERAESEHGKARILVNAAGVGRILPTLTESGAMSPRHEMVDVFKINVFGTLFLGQAFASSLTRLPAVDGEERGIIVNVSSIAAEDGIIGPSYAGSKGAVNGMCLSLAREYGPWGIRVVTVVPGTFATEAWQRGGSPKAEQYVCQSQAFPKRLGRADEFAELVAHICENQFLNGCCIRQDAGQRVPFMRDYAAGAAQ